MKKRQKKVYVLPAYILKVMCCVCGNPEHIDNLLNSNKPLQSDDWLAQSRALYDDGVITYTAPKGRYRKVFRKLERKTGLNFKRLKGKNAIGEIHCVYEPISYAAGTANRKPDIPTASFLLRVDPKYKNSHVEAHEIGHALGLSHNQHHHSVMNTDWTYERRHLSRYDRNNILDVYEQFLN